MTADKIKIFISYKHHPDDERILNELLDYMRGSVENAGGEFWVDHELRLGDDWDTLIKRRLAEAQIALVLVSQAYLWSDYITKVEIKNFIEKRQQNGLVIMPIILSPCLWEEHEWLKKTQFLPKGGETIEENYIDNGKRKRLYSHITTVIKDKVVDLRQFNIKPIPSIPKSAKPKSKVSNETKSVLVEPIIPKQVSELLVASLEDKYEIVSQVLEETSLQGRITSFSFASDIELFTAAAQQPTLAIFPTTHLFSYEALSLLYRVCHQTLVMLVESDPKVSFHHVAQTRDLLEIELARRGELKCGGVLSLYLHELTDNAEITHKIINRVLNFIDSLNQLNS